MATKHIVIITTSEEGKGAYGVTKDTDENVYFSVGIAESLGIEEFEELEAVVIKNDRPEPPLKAIRARRQPDDN